MASESSRISSNLGAWGAAASAHALKQAEPEQDRGCSFLYITSLSVAQSFHKHIPREDLSVQEHLLTVLPFILLKQGLFDTQALALCISEVDFQGHVARSLAEHNDVVVAGFAVCCNGDVPGADKDLVVVPSRLPLRIRDCLIHGQQLQALRLLGSARLPAAPVQQAYCTHVLHRVAHDTSRSGLRTLVCGHNTDTCLEQSTWRMPWSYSNFNSF